jgi:two-component system sensor histidine kinase KdpD
MGLAAGSIDLKEAPDNGGHRAFGARARDALAALGRFDLRGGPAGWVVVLAVVHACTLANLGFSAYLGTVNFALIYLIGSAWCALVVGRSAAILATALSVLEFDFLFVPPVYSFRVHDGRYLISFALMIALTLLVADLRARLIAQLALARRGERHMRAMFELSNELAHERSVESILRALVARVKSEVGPRAVAIAGPTPSYAARDAIKIPILASRNTIATLLIESSRPGHDGAREEVQLAQSLASLTGVAAERALHVEAAERSRVEIERQETRKMLLSALSHDLRTPMTAILGSATTLRDQDAQLAAVAREELLGSVVTEAERMTRLLNHILEMTWLDMGGIQLKKSWNDLEDLTRAAIGSIAGSSDGREITMACVPTVPLVECDATLMSQVLINLLENACRHTPSGSPVQVSIGIDRERARVDVLDSGPGIPPHAEGRLFERFFRGDPGRQGAGIGLGLAICRTILTLHGGEIRGRNRPLRGAEFSFWLPCAPAPRWTDSD